MLDFETGYKPVGTMTSSGATGPSLRMPAIVGTVQQAERTYGDDFYRKMNDPTGRYIGSVVKPIDPAAKTRAQAVMNQTPQGQAFNEAMGKPDESKMKFGKDLASGAASVAENIFTAQATIAQNNRQDELRQWQEQGKYWFDPNSDIKPDIDKYLSMMPKATDALIEGSPIAQFGEKGKGVPAALLINPAASDVANPLKLADRKMGEGFANYVGSRAAQGAMSSGLGPQMIAGGIVGMMEGIFGWNAAKAEDAKNTKLARDQYERDLKQWTINKNKRLRAESEQKYIEQQAAMKTARGEKEVDTAKRNARIVARRQQIAEVLKNAGSVNSANRASRLARFR